MSKQVVVGGGLSTSSMLFIVFVVMRLTDRIDLAWYWVAAPLWVPLGASLAVGAVLLVLVGLFLAVAYPIGALIDARRRVRRRVRK